MVFILKKLYQQEHNKECNDWVELEEYKPKVGKVIESMNLYQKGKGKTKGKRNEKNTEPKKADQEESSSSYQGNGIQGVVIVESKAPAAPAKKGKKGSKGRNQKKQWW